MKYRKLGTTDLDVSVICLGTMTWGEQNSQKEAFDQMNYSIERGVNFFDTAELYAVMPRKETYGKTEEIIGNWFKERKNRDKIILASKIASKSQDDLQWIRDGSNTLRFDRKNKGGSVTPTAKEFIEPILKTVNSPTIIPASGPLAGKGGSKLSASQRTNTIAFCGTGDPYFFPKVVHNEDGRLLIDNSRENETEFFLT